jgi:hypothetical protein
VETTFFNEPEIQSLPKVFSNIYKNRFQNISISEATFTKDEYFVTANIKLDLHNLNSKDLSEVRVHIFGSNFSNNHMASSFDCKGYYQAEKIYSFDSYSQQSVYYNNKTLN